MRQPTTAGNAVLIVRITLTNVIVKASLTA
jgi:hypothetical protein